MAGMRAIDDPISVDIVAAHALGKGMHTATGLPVPRTFEELCDPSSMALLVYDTQVGVVRQIADGPALVGRVKAALDLARAAKMRVLYTRHTSLPKELLGSFGHRMAMAWQHKESPDDVQPIFLPGAPAWQLSPEVAPLPSEAVFDKLAMSAFVGTPLSFVLRDCGIRAIAIVGIAVEIGIEPTCRHAADLGIVPVVLRDACGYGKKDAAERSFAALEFAGDTIVSDVATFGSLLTS